MRTLTTLLFLGLTAVFLVDSRSGVRLPIPPAVAVDRAALAFGPPRAALRDPPTLVNGPFRQTCAECHALFESPPEPRQPRLQHTHVVLDHGLNDQCFNCHAREARDFLVLRDGERIGYDRAPDLCSQCHGTVFRDWQRGTHGRTSGYWDAAAGEVRRLGCTECHDPHSPAYPRFEPLPGPRTMRMGTPRRSEADEAGENPLERWKDRRAEEGPR